MRPCECLVSQFQIHVIQIHLKCNCAGLMNCCFRGHFLFKEGIVEKMLALKPPDRSGSTLVFVTY